MKEITLSNFWISTGGISETYETVNIVFGSASAATPAFGTVDTASALRKAIDMMASQAQKMGCNGVLWIRFDQITQSMVGVTILASGTAVKVKL